MNRVGARATIGTPACAEAEGEGAAMHEIEPESEDLQAALKELQQYVDITESDLRKIYSLALKHARERLALKVPVGDVMTREVIAIKKNVDVQEAARLLSDNRISGLPVVDEENHVIGIVTETDILHTVGVKRGHAFRDILRHILGKPPPKQKTRAMVEDIMTSPAITTKPETDLREVARILDQKRIKRLPVVDGENKLIGVISRANIVRLLARP